MKDFSYKTVVYASFAGMAIVLIALFCLPGARLEFMIPAAMLGYVCVAGVYGQCPFRTNIGGMVLTLFYTISVLGIILNISYFTWEATADYSHPVMINRDALTDWSRAVNRAYGDELPPEYRILGIRYYGHIIQGLMWMFGRDIGVPLMFNALCYAMVLIMTGAITWYMTSSARTATLGIICASLMCYMLAQSTVLIKDVPLTMCVGAATMILVKWYANKGVTAFDICIFLFGVVGMTFMRVNFMPLFLVGVVLLGVRRKGRRAVGFDRRYIWAAVGCVAAMCLFKWHFYSLPISANTYGQAVDSILYTRTSYSEAWECFVGEHYVTMAWWRKLLWLPASVALQCAIPFPWNFARDMVFGPFMAVAHFAWFRYIAIGLFIYWAAVMMRRSPSAMVRTAVWGVAVAIIIAYFDSGRVSRYAIPLLPLVLPAVAYTLDKCYKKKSLWLWLGVYVAVLVPILVFCYYFQLSAL